MKDTSPILLNVSWGTYSSQYPAEVGIWTNKTSIFVLGGGGGGESKSADRGSNPLADVQIP